MTLYLLVGDVVPFAWLYLPVTLGGLLVLALVLRDNRRLASLCLGGVAAVLLLAPWGVGCLNEPLWWRILIACI